RTAEKFDDDIFILAIAQNADEMLEIFYRNAVDGLDDLADRIGVTARQLIREKRRGNDDQFFAVERRFVTRTRDKRVAGNAEEGHARAAVITAHEAIHKLSGRA